MLAVIATGGKQYLVRKGDVLRIEKREEEEGKKIVFEEVLLRGDEKKVEVGTPFLKGVKVEAKVLAHGKGDKVWGIKHKPKKRYKVKFGHRQPYTEVEITKI